MPTDPIVVLSLALAIVLFVGPMLLVMFEKRLVWPYGSPKMETSVGDSTGRARVMLNEAIAAGFEFLGWCSDIKGGHCKCAYAMLISPDAYTLLMVGIGQVASRPVQSSWLYSFSSDEQRVLITIDRIESIEADPLGRWLYRRVVSRGFAGLYRAHRNWVNSHFIGAPKSFPPGDELSTLDRLRRARFEAADAAGILKFIDLKRESWKYTPIGAVRYTLANYTTMLRATLLPSFSWQRN